MMLALWIAFPALAAVPTITARIEIEGKDPTETTYRCGAGPAGRGELLNPSHDPVIATEQLRLADTACSALPPNNVPEPAEPGPTPTSGARATVAGQQMQPGAQVLVTFIENGVLTSVRYQCVLRRSEKYVQGELRGQLVQSSWSRSPSAAVGLKALEHADSVCGFADASCGYQGYAAAYAQGGDRIVPAAPACPQGMNTAADAEIAAAFASRKDCHSGGERRFGIGWKSGEYYRYQRAVAERGCAGGSQGPRASERAAAPYSPAPAATPAVDGKPSRPATQ